MPIPTKPAHQALKQLLDQLDQVDKSVLENLKPRGATVSANGAAWVETLRTAMFEIEAWCQNPESGNDQFTLDVQPRR